jgi:exopolysaccharide production protein ExoQ
VLSPQIATLAYLCGIAGLFFLNRDKSVRTSKALWLPVIYLWIEGSRSISAWLGSPQSSTVDIQAQLDGSPLDTALAGLLLAIAIAVLVFRGKKVLRFLTAGWPIVLYFLFCLLSVVWSDFPGVALKRWVKATEDVAMILVVLTDREPIVALGRLFSRTAFVLIPLSILFNKYYPDLGRRYDAWSGMQTMNGVTTDKNILGAVTFVLLLGNAWSLLELLRSRNVWRRQRKILIAKVAIVMLGIYLLSMANSVTSESCLALGVVILLATHLRFIRRYPAALHALVLLLVLGVSSVLFLGVGSGAIHALGRKTNLTGRPDIWAAVIPLARNPIVGAGFESFWLSNEVHERLWQVLPGLPLNEAHDGYIEVYLELGWVGVALIACILIDGYRRSVAVFRRGSAWRGLFIAYIVSAVVYNLTEAGFRMMHPMWIYLMLASFGSVELKLAKISQITGRRRTRTAEQVSFPSARVKASGTGVQGFPNSRTWLAAKTSQATPPALNSL